MSTRLGSIARRNVGAEHPPARDSPPRSGILEHGIQTIICAQEIISPSMTAPYLCPSCRKLALRSWRSRSARWTGRTGFISLSTSQSEVPEIKTPKSSQNLLNTRKIAEGDRPIKPRPPRRLGSPFTNSKDYILENLFLGVPRGDENIAEHYKPRYSAAWAKDEEGGSKGNGAAEGPLNPTPEAATDFLCSSIAHSETETTYYTSEYTWK